MNEQFVLCEIQLKDNLEKDKTIALKQQIQQELENQIIVLKDAVMLMEAKLQERGVELRVQVRVVAERGEEV